MRRDKAWQARLGLASFGQACLGVAGVARFGQVWLGVARHRTAGKARHVLVRPGLVSQGGQG